MIPLRFDFDRQIKLKFHGSTVTSDGGHFAYRELDDALGLARAATGGLQDTRTGQNTLHTLTALLRQSIYSRLAGYEDVNDAERLCLDPTMRIVVGSRAKDTQAASTSEMARFETEPSAQKNGFFWGKSLPSHLRVAKLDCWHHIRSLEGAHPGKIGWDFAVVGRLVKEQPGRAGGLVKE